MSQHSITYYPEEHRAHISLSVQEIKRLAEIIKQEERDGIDHEKLLGFHFNITNCKLTIKEHPCPEQ